MNTDKTRLHKPGFALLLVLLVVLQSVSFAGDLKAVRSFDVKLPELREFMSFGIAFVRNGQLAFWYDEHGAGKLSKRDEVRESDPWRLNATIFDTASGESLRTLEWPTRRMSSDIVASNSQVMVLTGPLVRCYSSDLKLIGQVQLGEPQRGHDFGFLAPSPGGKIVWAVESAETIALQRIDTEQCKLTTRISIPQGAVSLSANDDSLITTNRMRISRWTPRTDFTVLYQAEKCCLRNGRFVGQKTIMAYHEEESAQKGTPGPHPQTRMFALHVVIVDADGKLLLEDAVKKDYGIGPIVTSAGGGVAAAVSPDNSESVRISSFGASKVKVMIYDLATMKRTTTIEAPFSGGIVRVALSPDGREAAVLSGEKISIYEIGRGR